jgi:hypothetical protein
MCGTVLSPLGQLCISGRVSHRSSRDMGLRTQYVIGIEHMRFFLDVSFEYVGTELINISAFIGLTIYRADRFCKYITVQQKYKTMVNLVAMAANSLVKSFQFRSTQLQ